ncbi:MAG: class I SAM-dependent RNA methyltransferase, partial [Paracoccaceae bacterium]
KQQVNKAPMRETMAALFLRACGYDGAGPVYDPMCGSGTFPIEAAEVAVGLAPGRLRNFAFEQLVGYDPISRPKMHTPSTGVQFFGTDRDSGAIAMSRANATRAGVQDICTFETRPISDMVPPTTDKGLVILNPPYGGRIGNKKPLYGLYAALGARLKDQFSGWRIGLITSEAALAKTTGLTWDTPGPIVDHGGTKIQLWQTQL